MIEMDEQTKGQIKQMLGNMENPVRIMLFSGDNCQFCGAIKEILSIVKDLGGDKIIFEEHDFNKENGLATSLKVDKYPATVIKAGKKMVYFYGLMSGYEFGTFIEDIVDLSKGDTVIDENTINKLEKIDKEMRIQVFVTPTCPYCPRMVRLAHQFAIINPKIQADMIEAMEFPDLSNKYAVSGVPKTVIDDKDAIVGAVPEQMFLEKVLKVAGVQ